MALPTYVEHHGYAQARRPSSRTAPVQDLLPRDAQVRRPCRSMPVWWTNSQADMLRMSGKFQKMSDSTNGSSMCAEVHVSSSLRGAWTGFQGRRRWMVCLSRHLSVRPFCRPSLRSRVGVSGCLGDDSVVGGTSSRGWAAQSTDRKAFRGRWREKRTLVRFRRAEGGGRVSPVEFLTAACETGQSVRRWVTKRREQRRREKRKTDRLEGGWKGGRGTKE